MLEAVPNGDDAGWLLPNANCEDGTEDVGVVIEEGLSKGDAIAGGLLAPNENEVFCAAGPKVPVGVLGCAPKGLACEGAPKTEAFCAALLAPNPSGEGLAGCVEKLNDGC